jgi:hypothetical protein
VRLERLGCRVSRGFKVSGDKLLLGAVSLALGKRLNTCLEEDLPSMHEPLQIYLSVFSFRAVEVHNRESP